MPVSLAQLQKREKKAHRKFEKLETQVKDLEAHLDSNSKLDVFEKTINAERKLHMARAAEKKAAEALDVA